MLVITQGIRLTARETDAEGEPTATCVVDTGNPTTPGSWLFKFYRVEGFDVEQIFKGWAEQGLADQDILSKGFECFDALYAQFKK
jgi:hypothetical protein